MNKDICTLLSEIKLKTSWGEVRLAAELKVSQPTVNRILKGQKECKGSTLKAIEELHERVFGQALAEIDSPCTSTPKKYPPDESGRRKENRRTLKDRRNK